MRRFAFVAAWLLAGAVALYFWPRRREPAPAARTSAAAPLSIANRPVAAASSPDASGLTGSLELDYPIAAPLNAPDSTIARDLDALRQLFETWQSNFPHEGNPVGENADIAAALTGANRLGLVLIPKNHRALNAQGELCDRWGTPFRFHQLSGSRMEIRSAGPDRKFATADDAVWNPP